MTGPILQTIAGAVLMWLAFGPLGIAAAVVIVAIVAANELTATR